MIEVGDAERVRVGATGTPCRLTVTVTLFDALPPDPVHVSVYVLVTVGVIPCVPEIALASPQLPPATQLVAFVDDHESVEACPTVMEEGLAVNVTTGIRFVIGSGVTGEETTFAR